MKDKSKIGARAIKRELKTIFQGDYEYIFNKIKPYPVESLIGPVISFFYHKDQNVKFRAIKLLGRLIDKLYQTNKERARIVMRRLMWNLNDESGGIGWGSPEAMGEAMTLNSDLANEFGNMLISYINMSGNYLEHPELQKGALWGVYRCGLTNREIISEAKNFLPDYFGSSDSETRGLSLLASISLGLDKKILHKTFINDTESFKVFIDDKFVKYKITDLLNPENKIK